jgi:hypothetical protein
MNHDEEYSISTFVLVIPFDGTNDPVVIKDENISPLSSLPFTTPSADFQFLLHFLNDPTELTTMNCKVITTFVVIFVFLAVETEANGEFFTTLKNVPQLLFFYKIGASCQLYGHSCLGGHGKRSDSASEMDVNSMQARMAVGRMNNLLQRLLARRVMSQSPDVISSILSSNEYSDLEKRSPDYIQTAAQ